MEEVVEDSRVGSSELVGNQFEQTQDLRDKIGFFEAKLHVVEVPESKLCTFGRKTGHHNVDDLNFYLYSRCGEALEEILYHIVLEIVGVPAHDFQLIENNLFNVDFAGFREDVDVGPQRCLDGGGAVADGRSSQGTLKQN